MSQYGAPSSSSTEICWSMTLRNVSAELFFTSVSCGSGTTRISYWYCPGSASLTSKSTGSSDCSPALSSLVLTTRFWRRSWTVIVLVFAADQADARREVRALLDEAVRLVVGDAHGGVAHLAARAERHRVDRHPQRTRGERRPGRGGAFEVVAVGQTGRARGPSRAGRGRRASFSPNGRSAWSRRRPRGCRARRARPARRRAERETDRVASTCRAAKAAPSRARCPWRPATGWWRGRRRSGACCANRRCPTRITLSVVRDARE